MSSIKSFENYTSQNKIMLLLIEAYHSVSFDIVLYILYN